MSAAASFKLLAIVVCALFLGNVTARSTGGSLHAPVCDDGEFRCASSQMCILDFWVCDKDNDCPNGEDEANCEHQAICDRDEFMCASQDECIPDDWRCDGDADCSDGSDELTCDTQQGEQTHYGSRGNHHQGHRHFRHMRPRNLN